MPADRDAPAPARPERVLELERGFRRAGLPLFIEGYAATTDVFNRAVPLLGLVFLGEMLGAAKFEWSPLANLAALAGALAIFALLSFTTQEAWQIFPGAEYCRLRAQASDG